MGNSLNVGSLQDAVIDRFRAVSVATDNNGVIRIRSFSDGGQMDPRVVHAHFDEHRYSLDSMQRARYMRTSCTTIPEEDIVSGFFRVWKMFKMWRTKKMYHCGKLLN